MGDVSFFSEFIAKVLLIGVFFIIVGILFAACISIIIYTLSLQLAGWWISLKENSLGQAFTTSACVCTVTTILTISGVFFPEFFVIAFLLLLILPTIIIMLVYNLSFSKAALLQYCAIPMHFLISLLFVGLACLVMYYGFDFSLSDHLEKENKQKNVATVKANEAEASFLPPPENNEFAPNETLAKKIEITKHASGGAKKQQATKNIKPDSKTMAIKNKNQTQKKSSLQ